MLCDNIKLTRMLLIQRYFCFDIDSLSITSAFLYRNLIINHRTACCWRDRNAVQFNQAQTFVTLLYCWHLSCHCCLSNQRIYCPATDNSKPSAIKPFPVPSIFCRAQVLWNFRGLNGDNNFVLRPTEVSVDIFHNHCLSAFSLFFVKYFCLSLVEQKWGSFNSNLSYVFNDISDNGFSPKNCLSYWHVYCDKLSVSLSHFWYFRLTFESNQMFRDERLKLN